jgi:hypothetical protein
MVQEMRLSREPAVYVALEAPGSMFQFIIGNSGKTPAVNIRFVVEKDIKGLLRENNSSGIASIPVIEKGISCLAPEKILKWRAGIFRPSETEKENNILQIRVLYNNEKGKRFKRIIKMDMAMFDIGCLKMATEAQFCCPGFGPR